MMYCSWHMKCTDRIFCHFLPFYSTKNPKHQKFWKNEKKNPEYIIILHKCTKNHDHMLSYSWVMVCDSVIVIFHFGLFFAFLHPTLHSHPPHSTPTPYTPLTIRKIKILQKWKKYLQISLFYTCVTKIVIGWCTVHKDMVCDRRTVRQAEKVKYRGGWPT